MHSHFHQLVTKHGGCLENSENKLSRSITWILKLPLDKSDEAENDDEDIPEPDDKVDFVNDDIKSKDAESIERILSSPWTILIVCATSNLQ